jgi:hypothetical protein
VGSKSGIGEFGVLLLIVYSLFKYVCTTWYDEGCTVARLSSERLVPLCVHSHDGQETPLSYSLVIVYSTIVIYTSLTRL